MIIKWISITFRKIFLLSKRFTNKHKHNFKYVMIFLLFLLSLYFVTKEEGDEMDFFESLQENLSDSIDGCIFPEINPFSDIAMFYDRSLPKVVCGEADWVECKIAECYVKEDILNTMYNIVCLYKDIVYVNDNHFTISEPIKVLGDGKYVLNASDSFKVSCYGYEKNGWPWISKRWYGYKSGIRPIPPLPSPGREDSLNVLIVAFDSASHHGFLRKMPKSYKTLIQDLNAVILNGYNIVGDGTPDALFPILSGRTELEHNSSARQRYSKEVLINSDLFLFHTAKEDGYQTAYYEDMPWIGTFQWRYNGFNRLPADHYLRSLLMAATSNGLNMYNGANQKYCLGGTPNYLFMLDLTEKFMSLNTKRFCFTFIADICHDDFNMISTADDDLVKFLMNIKTSGTLNNTLLIVMGDHGPRFTPMRKHYQGKIEERMPFVSIILPETLQRDRPDAVHHLKANSEVLTTPFDIHTTILDAMGLEKFASKFVAPKARMLRGLSLLRQIPKSRNCEDAAILPHWCVCLNRKWYNLRPKDRYYKRAGDALAEFVNNMTSERRNVCEERTLISIEWVTRQNANDVTNVTYYQAMIIMSPKRAVFEGSMQYVPSTDQFVISERDVSRISTYGNEPACISATHPHLNKYCYCKNKLSVLGYVNF